MNSVRWRTICDDDLPGVARMNRDLQEDEGSRPMELSDLRTRMARWLADGYSAVVFEIDEGIAAYALYRNTDSDSEGSDGIYLRQFFVDRERRRSGIGREAMRLLFEEVWPKDCRIVLEVLATNPGGRAFWSSLGFREHSTGLEFTAQMRSRSKETT